MKTIRLTPSEIANADKTYDGVEYTIIRRPQPDGKFLIAAIRLVDGKVMQKEYATDQSDVRRAVGEVNRWLDKLANGGSMSHRSRNRPIGY